jgi:hypothetical protein
LLAEARAILAAIATATEKLRHMTIGAVGGCGSASRARLAAARSCRSRSSAFARRFRRSSSSCRR